MSASSGDLLADRRYEWGAGALKDRDFEGAADLFRQVIEIAPQWAPAHLSLGDALLGLGDPEGAQTAWGQAGAGEHSASIHSDWRKRAEGSGLRQGRETDGPQANMIIKDCAQKNI